MSFDNFPSLPFKDDLSWFYNDYPSSLFLNADPLSAAAENNNTGNLTAAVPSSASLDGWSWSGRSSLNANNSDLNNRLATAITTDAPPTAFEANAAPTTIGVGLGWLLRHCYPATVFLRSPRPPLIFSLLQWAIPVMRRFSMCHRYNHHGHRHRHPGRRVREVPLAPT